MSPLIVGLTVVSWAIPLTIGIAGFLSASRGMFLLFGLLIVLYGAVWIWCRPSRFVITPGSLDIVFPGWTRSIPIQNVKEVKTASRQAFRQEFGLALRIGVGGLWGGFGWLWTKRRGMVEFYISRLDGFIQIERHSAMPLLITPENPERMVHALEMEYSDR